MSTEAEIAQLEAALAALEAQRPVLGDAVVDAALGPIRASLAALGTRAQTRQQRKQATVLFADVSGFTTLSETMDAEVVAGTINDLWSFVDQIILDHGGRIDKHIGDAVMALWGADTAREDDPERAVRAALAMQAAVDQFCETHNVPVSLRIGINTGLVVLGPVGTTGEFTAMGDAVNLASRLEHAAPVNGVLISHDTYRHVRGVFDVVPREPLAVKGKAEPVQTYVVRRAKRRAFRQTTRGVEGIETRMIGRDRELGALQDAYRDAFETSETQAVTVVGEAGVGKSRLLYEFNNWLELRPETVHYFKGRAVPNTQRVPFSLFHDLFAFRFDILDSDPAALALEKFRAGMAGSLEAGQADVVGHWLGFDFSASEAVRGLLGSDGFARSARAYLVRYWRTMAAEGPVVLLLEDVHWADDASLDLAAYLPGAVPEARLLLIAITRPSLFERRPHWGEGEAAFRQIRLTPLSRRLSRALVAEILQRVDEVPEALHELIIDSAEGNPFYVEELVKMLIDQGVIERGVTSDELRVTNEERGRGGAGEPGSRGGTPLTTDLLTTDPLTTEHWTVQTDKLNTLKVPPTLTGLLQARLDGLPPPEREALQRASVVGRLFWDDCVAALLEREREAVNPTLETIRGRELIFRREHSTFAGAAEYTFRHALLRDVAYETVLLRQRAVYHSRVAHWLEAHAGERRDEYLGLIAEHFAQAGDFDTAANYQQQSGEQALRVSAFREARAAFERALALRAQGSGPPTEAREHYLQLGEACVRLSDFAAAEAALEQALALARQCADGRAQAEALAWLSEVAISVGQTEAAGRYLDEALPLARPVGGVTLLRVLTQFANYLWQTGSLDSAEPYAQEARRLAQDLGHVPLQIRAIRSLGIIAGLRREFDSSRRHFETCIALARQIGDRFQESSSESNLGATKQYAGDYAGAVVHYLASLAVDEELGMIDRMAINAHNLADAYNSLGQFEQGRRYAVECIRLAGQVGAVPLQLAALVPLAEVLIRQEQPARALALLGLARAHPSTPRQKEVGINEALAAIELSPEEIEAGLAAGSALDLATVVQEILNK